MRNGALATAAMAIGSWTSDARDPKRLSSHPTAGFLLITGCLRGVAHWEEDFGFLPNISSVRLTFKQFQLDA
jgi:hypothetical protein